MFQLVNFKREMVMSQSTHEQSNPDNAPTSEQKKQEPPVASASPDDPIGVTSPGTGKPGQQEE